MVALLRIRQAFWLNNPLIESAPFSADDADNQSGAVDHTADINPPSLPPPPPPSAKRYSERHADVDSETVQRGNVTDEYASQTDQKADDQMSLADLWLCSAAGGAI